MAINESTSIYRALINARVGEYIIDDYIGSRHHAAIYLAHSSHFQAHGILNIFGLTESTAGSLEMRLKEARKAALIHHPSVASIGNPCSAKIDFQGSIKSVFYLPMQCPHGTCQEMPPFKDRPLYNGDLSSMISLLDGLNEIHNHDIVHGDIRPSNILLFDDDTHEGCTILRITGFGLANALSLGEFDCASNYDNDNIALAFAAPERFHQGLSTKSDIYSMGASLFYMITGTLPITPADPENISFQAWRLAHEEGQRPDASVENAYCPPELAMLLRRMMSARAEERPQLDECKKQLQAIRLSTKQSLMSRLRSISINAPEDFSANFDQYAAGEKRAEPDIR
ncbi:MAG: hypothetical protein DMF61_25630 [Blastocatellia bacterium AA13]|nr:MAG: hypothetical protein DMF61_25630 [Blastocatellia bacterium AA13]